MTIQSQLETYIQEYLTDMFQADRTMVSKMISLGKIPAIGTKKRVRWVDQKGPIIQARNTAQFELTKKLLSSLTSIGVTLKKEELPRILANAYIAFSDTNGEDLAVIVADTSQKIAQYITE